MSMSKHKHIQRQTARQVASTTPLPADTLVWHDMFGPGRVVRTRDEFVATIQFTSLSGPVMVMRSQLTVTGGSA